MTHCTTRTHPLPTSAECSSRGPISSLPSLASMPLQGGGAAQLGEHEQMWHKALTSAERQSSEIESAGIGRRSLTGQRENTVGVIYLLLAALCWGFVASTVKQLTARVDPYTISFFRVSLATVVFSLLLRRKNWRRIGWFLLWALCRTLSHRRHRWQGLEESLCLCLIRLLLNVHRHLSGWQELTGRHTKRSASG